MIVVTGPGRSGTSFLARLYGELGFDPGGRWEPFVDAGHEHPEVVALNLAVAREMGVSIRERRGGHLLQALGSAVRASEGRVPARIRQPVVAAVDAMRYSRSTPDLMDWGRVDKVVERHGEEMHTLAKELAVVKDPRFCFTLRAWLAAAAPVQAVVFTIRALDAMTDSRVRAHMYSRRASGWAKNNYCYGTGLLLTAAAEHRVPVSMLRYPDFLEDPDELYRSLPLPESRSPQDFQRAFVAIYDPALVHDRR